MKNESGLHFLGWAILAHINTGWLAVFCMGIAAGYAVLSLIQSFGNDR
jgi:hypothetical protein